MVVNDIGLWFTGSERQGTKKPEKKPIVSGKTRGAARQSAAPFLVNNSTKS